MSQGIDIRQSGSALIVDEVLHDADGAAITTAATLQLYERQSDGTLLPFDFDNDEFTATPDEDEAETTHQAGGLHTCVIADTSGFTAGRVYYQCITHADLPAPLWRKWQYGGAEGDLTLTAGNVHADVQAISGDTTAADNLEAAADGTGYNLGGGQIVAASVAGNIAGKVLGGGSGTIVGTGAWVLDHEGEEVANQTTAAIAAAQSTTAAAQATAAASRVTTALPAVAPNTAGGLLTYGAGTGQLNPSSGAVDLVDVPNSNAVGAIRDGLATSEQVSQITDKLPTSAYLAGSDSEDGAVTVDVQEIVGGVVAALAGQQITITTPYDTTNQLLTIVRGDSYLDADGRAITVTIDVAGTMPNDISDATVSLKYVRKHSGAEPTVIAGDITTAVGNTKVFRFDLTSEQTGAMELGRMYNFEVEVLLEGDSDKPVTPVSGEILVLKDLRGKG